MVAISRRLVGGWPVVRRDGTTWDSDLRVRLCDHVQRGDRALQRGGEIVGARTVIERAGPVAEEEADLGQAADVQGLRAQQSVGQLLQSLPRAPYLGLADRDVEVHGVQRKADVL